MPRISRRKSIRELFWSKVDQQTCLGDICGCQKGLGHCWPWIGRLWPNGYGNFDFRLLGGDKRSVTASRMAFELAKGMLLPGFEACHHCDNGVCCRPEHLFPGTQKENLADMYRKGRGNTGEKHGTFTKPERIARGERNRHAKLRDEEARAIYALKGIRVGADVTSQFHVSESRVYAIWNHHAWTHIHQ